MTTVGPKIAMVDAEELVSRDANYVAIAVELSGKILLYVCNLVCCPMCSYFSV